MKSTSVNHRIKQVLSRIFPKCIIVDGYSTGFSAITFDDGPCPGNTERILNVLDSKNIKATFFLSGDMAEKSPDLINLIHSKGHQLANHGYYHKKSIDLEPGEYIKGVIRTHELLENVTGVKLKKVFRPPFGELTIKIGLDLIKHGYQFAMWSYDTHDSFVDTGTEIIDHILKDKPRKAEVFLMHEDYPHSASALDELLDILQKDGHLFKRLDEM